MKFLKGLVLTLLSFLLFLSISIFGFAFMLNNTILNPDFVTSELDKLDTPSLAGELIGEQIQKGELPEEFGTALINTIDKLDPLVKEQISAATYSTYDYLLGKSQSLDLALILNNTILSSDFVVSLVDELDIASLAGEFLRQQFTEEVPEEMERYLVKPLDDTITELEPWLKEQISAAADPILAYLLGQSQSLNVVISLEPFNETLKDKVWEAILESPPPELAMVPQAMWEPLFDQLYEQLSGQIPSTFEFNESLLGTETPAKIAEALTQVEVALEQVRQAIGYFQLGYNVLIGFMLLLILGIVLINHQVRGATRELGTIFLTYGAFEYALIFVAKHFAGPQLAQLPIPSQLQAWLPQLVGDFLAPLEMFSLGLLIGGVVLLIVSFAYKPHQPSF